MELRERIKKRLNQAKEDLAESLPDDYDFESAEIRDLLEDILKVLPAQSA